MASNETRPGSQEPATNGKAAEKAAPNGKKELKILMLHGYTQSGPLFDTKTRALAKLLTKALSPAPLSTAPRLVFPTGPHRLRARDVPGFASSSSSSPPASHDGAAEEEGDEDSDSWAWWRKDEASGAYAGFEAGMRRVAEAVRGAGGVDGVCGFSQGGCLAALVAAALEGRSPPAGCPSPSSPASASEAAADWTWLDDLRAANGGRPLKFCVVYSGFWAPVPGLQWLYGGSPGDGAGNPPEEKSRMIATPTLHFLGSLDSVVEEGRSRALIDRCRDPVVVEHPGGHHVPVARDRVMPLVGFLRQVVGGQGKL
ncbi:hypothetical protein DL766_007546 [Monosporascus sp. MC13-8B]|uniref:Serine hydrolase domain-containing protein n=1 Tax=Monosporascus cannonballus TaxID=155416 RepID=A0ABY0HAA4_9PEZI|nr:hypothetical protein DL762_005124 [Monosporascus cannonballus]RYO91511.1 hypothetical protein DL763_004975 [Monosporascus cannonballus]RYP23227.1 hypothetical protein DL766_007546 [Monosporascus sp. MC13-8B]